MLIRTALLSILAAAVAAAQAGPPEISGRITLNDEQRSVLPGVRVTVTSDGQAQQVFTDQAGRFALRPKALGTYRVVLELAGFRTVAGEIALSSAVPKAFLGWSMEIGCLETQTMVFGSSREAAKHAASILHVRVVEALGPMSLSEYPECSWQLRYGYSTQVVASVGRTGAVGRSQILTHEDELTPGREYVVLSWPTTEPLPDGILPIVVGRVVAPIDRELNGRRLHEALTLLQRWSQEKAP